MDALKYIRLNGKNAVDLHQQALILSMIKMLNEIISYLEHYFHLFGTHRLDNELLIIAIEEEGATLTRSFASTQDIFDVLFNI